MTIKTLAQKGVPKRQIARQLNLSEGSVRYHLKRIATDEPDGRALQQRRAGQVADAIAHWHDTMGSISNTAELHKWLVTEHSYAGSLRSVQRFISDRYPPPKKKTRRRVETPPGAQAQVDWAHFPGLIIHGVEVELYAFAMILSHSRMPALIWSDSMCMIRWLQCHNSAFARLGGIPAVVRVDNCKTAVAHGAGPWGVINETYRRYAQSVRFHVDPCLPREPAAKGKVERLIRTCRGLEGLRARAWDDVVELQNHTDAMLDQSVLTRQCPATGSTIAEAYQAEKRFLAPLPPLPAPFDTVCTRTVGSDCMISFEARQYSVPFRFVGEQVEVRGAHRQVQILHGAQVIATHPRGTDERIVIDPQHYTGESTQTHLPPMPLGKLGEILARLGETPVQQRPADLYQTIAEELAR